MGRLWVVFLATMDHDDDRVRLLFCLENFRAQACLGTVGRAAFPEDIRGGVGDVVEEGRFQGNAKRGASNKSDGLPF